MSEIINLTKYAIKYLSKYSSSKKNLEKILKNKIMRMKIEKRNKAILYNSIPSIILNLETKNIISDSDYAASKIRFFTSSGKSKIFINRYLFQKGINNEIINELLKVKENENSNWELESAKVFARKKNLHKNNKDKEKNLAKLARAGFSYEIAKKILEQN